MKQLVANPTASANSPCVMPLSSLILLTNGAMRDLIVASLFSLADFSSSRAASALEANVVYIQL